MPCSCSNKTDIRSRCNPFDADESRDCSMQVESIFWYFQNDSALQSNLDRFKRLMEIFPLPDAVGIYTLYITETLTDEIASDPSLTFDDSKLYM
jgi:hypothetical protein